MTPEQIITTIDSKENGCESCQWERGTSNRGRKVCDASQPAYPDGGKTICIGWYRPRAKKGNGRGRVVNNGERGGVR